MGYYFPAVGFKVSCHTITGNIANVGIQFGGYLRLFIKGVLAIYSDILAFIVDFLTIWWYDLSAMGCRL